MTALSLLGKLLGPNTRYGVHDGHDSIHSATYAFYEHIVLAMYKRIR
jgi:hypothetical protein